MVKRNEKLKAVPIFPHFSPRLGCSKSSVAAATKLELPGPTKPPEPPADLSRGEVRLARATLLQALRDATGEPVSRALRIARFDAQRLFHGVELARDLETLCGLAKLDPGMVLEAVHERDPAEIRAAIDLETRLYCNLGMDGLDP